MKAMRAMRMVMKLPQKMKAATDMRVAAKPGKKVKRTKKALPKVIAMKKGKRDAVLPIAANKEENHENQPRVIPS